MFGLGTHETTETHEFDRPAALTVETDAGGLTLQTHDAERVVVEAHKRGDSQRELDDARVVGEGTDPLAVRIRREGGTDATVALTVSVPADLTVERAATTNGAVEATGVSPREVDTTNGAVTVTDATGSLTVDSTNGGVTLDGVEGDVAVSTTNGGVQAEGVAGTATVETVAGGVTLREIDALGDVATSAGQIEAVVPAIHGDTTVESTAGGVRLSPGPELDADVEISSAVGSVTAPALSGESGLVGASASGVVGDGGPTLTVTTRAGSVAFETAADSTAE